MRKKSKRERDNSVTWDNYGVSASTYHRLFFPHSAFILKPFHATYKHIRIIIIIFFLSLWLVTVVPTFLNSCSLFVVSLSLFVIILRSFQREGGAFFLVLFRRLCDCLPDYFFFLYFFFAFPFTVPLSPSAIH